MKKLLAIVLSLCYCVIAMAQVGTWRNYLAYHDVQNICKADNNLFVLASNGLYLYNLSDQSITTYDKVNGLSDTHITHIAWSNQAKKLIIVYENANIDLIDINGNVTNISALYSKAMTEDKTVSSITIEGIYAWLQCTFGYVKVNLQKAEITETYTKNNPNYPTSLPDNDEYKDLEVNISLVSTLNPDGPKYNNFYESKFYNGKLYTTGGFFLSAFPDELKPGTIQVFDENNWKIYEDELQNITGYRYVDINCLDIDPNDEEHVFAGGRCGLYEFENGKLINYYNKDNSPLGGAYSGGKELGNDYVLVHSIKFDKEGNLWVLNSRTKDVNLLKLTKEKKWENHFQKQLAEDNGLGLPGLRNFFYNKKGLLCFVNTSSHNPFFATYNPSTDKMVIQNKHINQDGTPYTIYYVNCASEDLEGNIWLGTDQGLFYLDKDELEQENATFYQVKVPRNDGTNYADYLLSGINITNISIDGGNRKWISTSSSGVFLISADNMEQIHNFKEDNSFILSNNIYSTAINPTNGRVYILTNKGLCSYDSNATQASDEMTKDNVYAYPNPVTSDYTGLINIVGLSYDADVKITTSNGVVVAEGRSNGGSFTWNGMDKNGKRVASGIYMVITATNDGKKGTVCKIAVIR